MARKAGTTEYAVLGMLALGPGSGYDLKKRVEGSIAHFWSESYGQIYPILAHLASQGLVRVTPLGPTAVPAGSGLASVNDDIHSAIPHRGEFDTSTRS